MISSVDLGCKKMSGATKQGIQMVIDEHDIVITGIFQTSQNCKALKPGRVAQSVDHLTCKSRGPRFDIRSGHILSFLLLLIQEGQLSVTGESMCTRYWLST